MSTMNVAATLEEIPRPAWIALMVLAFIVYWPLGLAILAYLIWSRRMSCWGHHRGWPNSRRYTEAAQRWCGPRRGASSGNRAFDEYREETLRRLEDEQRDFVGFLERLRFAKDRAEFDQFMAERRSRPQGPEPQPQA
jgi:Protein of unknown function (DUF2852)